jgi:pre-mRNA-splicing factor ATP-dependent RNA helicase DHX38/PRP16
VSLIVRHITPAGHSLSFIFFGVCFPAEAEAKAKQGGDKEDYKGDSKFASHLKASTSQSAFARNRTLKEQREYLPAFACREDLMKILRDNQGLLVS